MAESSQKFLNALLIILIILLIIAGIYFIFFYKDPIKTMQENVKTNVKAEENNISVPQCSAEACPQREIVNGVATGKIICVKKAFDLQACTNFSTPSNSSLIYSLHR